MQTICLKIVVLDAGFFSPTFVGARFSDPTSKLNAVAPLTTNPKRIAMKTRGPKRAVAGQADQPLNIETVDLPGSQA